MRTRQLIQYWKRKKLRLISILIQTIAQEKASNQRSNAYKKKGK